MPEGPELHFASQFINSICKGRLFSGKVRKSPVHKCSEVEWDEPSYTITSASRGKELKVFLKTQAGSQEDHDVKTKSKSGVNDESRLLQILFNFGMSGKIDFTSTNELPKHAHLSFFTKEEPSMALSFVDPRRFGKWRVGADWSPDRGPCVMFEYLEFRSNVLRNLDDSTFNRPLCEALLNQKFFNGIGNYLRAEIIFRAGVRPFEQARSILTSLSDVPEDVKVEIKDEVKEAQKVKVKSESSDILLLCNLLPLEIVGLGTSLYSSEDYYSEDSKFWHWLRCYYKPGMKTIADHNKRTLWYNGDPGPMAPKEGKVRGVKRQFGTKDKGMTKKTKKELHKMDKVEENSEHKKCLRSSSASAEMKMPTGSALLFKVNTAQTAKKGKARKADKRKKTSARDLSAAGRKVKNDRPEQAKDKKPRKTLSADSEVKNKKATHHKQKLQVTRSRRSLTKMELVRDSENDCRSDKKRSKKK